MTTIAHLTDVHLDGSPERAQRLGQALARARWADHLVLTGDLTAHGDIAEFAQLAELLAEWPVWQVTLVPGNHDLGDYPWTDVLVRTELGRFAATSLPGALADRQTSVILALSTQHTRRALAFSARGRLDRVQLHRARLVAAANEHRPVLLVMHHGPQLSLLQPFDGLSNRADVLELLRFPTTYVLCGHDHRSLDLYNGRVFCAPSVLENQDPLRLYKVWGSLLIPTHRGDKGRYLLGMIE